MKTSELIEGLQILAKYRDDDGCHTGADHDVIYAYATDRRVETPDFEKLVQLGWRQDHWCGDEGYDFAADYNIDESWIAFT